MSEENPTPTEIRDEYREAFWKIRGDLSALMVIVDGILAIVAADRRGAYGGPVFQEEMAHLRQRLLTAVEAHIVRIDGLPEEIQLEREGFLHALMIEGAKKMLGLDES